jgi:hypothetical protein
LLITATMQKIILIALLSFGCCEKAFSQDTAIAATEPAFDSAAVLSDLMSLLDSAQAPVSYGLFSVGMGNRLFSVSNNRLNARQTTHRLVFNPSIGYFHKSGFSLSAGSSLLNDEKKGFGPTQFSITPAYDLTGNKEWGLGISYSRYIALDKYSVYASPVQNDVYAYVNYKKWWIEPGIAMGYSTGRYREINKFTLPSTGNTYIDTGTFKLRTFSFVASASHDFEWDNIFDKKDALGFTPSLMVNFGSDSTATVSHTLFPNLLAFLKRKNRLPKLSGKNSFSAQSVALSLDFTYGIGNFTILPQLYLDYFLPATDEKRFTQTFTLAVGYSF